MTSTVKPDAFLLTSNIGPEVNIALLTKAAQEYEKGNVDISILYQVQALFSETQYRYFNMPTSASKAESKYDTTFLELMSKIVSYDDRHESRDILDEYAKERLKLKAEGNTEMNSFHKDLVIENSDFLQLTNPHQGLKTIMDTCRQFPKEWTILQVCKGPRPQTTYSVYEEIHKRDADIYLTLLKHARSSDYPDPICLRFSETIQKKLFDDFHKIVDACKEYMQVDSKNVLTHEEKLKYFERLKKLDNDVREAIVTLKQYFSPWLCLFRGAPSEEVFAGRVEYKKRCFAAVDDLCSRFKWKQRERVLLSTVALNISELSVEEIDNLCEELSTEEEARSAAKLMLKKLQGNNSSSFTTEFDKDVPYKVSHYPCILIVDERIDHIFWEELNVSQEMCRVNSLQCLQKLYTMHKAMIQKGYLCLDIKSGGCIINPDNNLPKTQMRLQSFFDYWTPTWVKKCAEKPLEEELLGDYFKRDCYVYAGHGSGLQYINGKHISKGKIDAVVFLFGCESTRMHSNGLYGDLVGPHIYYHAAKCPCLVGAILPALDAQMDSVAVEILSRWIPPIDKTDLIAWQNIDSKLWTKKGTISPKSPSAAGTKGDRVNYQIGSLCGAIARIHMRGSEKYYYNTVPYVCRGLPVWNCTVQPLPG